jgi:hypothetical protein
MKLNQVTRVQARTDRRNQLRQRRTRQRRRLTLKYVCAKPSQLLLTIETWQLSQLEHILKRPDSYIGSVETITQPMWTYDAENKRMVHREVKYVPGFFKIVDEILVNAADNKV